MWVLLPLIAGLIAFAGYQAKKLVDELQTNFTGISIIKKGTNLFSTGLDLKFDLINPTEGSVTVNGVSGSVLFDNKPAATFNYPKAFKIPAAADGGKVTLHIPAVVSNSAILGTILQYLSNRSTPEISMNLKTYVFGTSFNSVVPLAKGSALKIAS